MAGRILNAVAPKSIPATADNSANAVSSAAPTKVAKASIVYVKADGTVVNFATPDAIAVRTEFANKVTRDLAIADVNESISYCAVLQGLAIRTQRSYQAIKDIDSVIEAYDETVADLKNGVWIEGRTGAPKVTMLSQAIVLSLEGAGQTVDEARRLSIIEKLKDADYRDKAEANEQVKVHLAALRLDAAKKRAAEAKASLKEAGGADLSMFE